MIALTGLYLVVFGAITVAGGVLGYVKAKSVASIVAGTVSGALLVIAGVLARNGSRAALVVGLVVSLALLGRFGVVFVKTRKVMPAGLIAVLALAGVAITAAALA